MTYGHVSIGAFFAIFGVFGASSLGSSLEKLLYYGAAPTELYFFSSPSIAFAVESFEAESK